jgi:hypothetical protein
MGRIAILTLVVADLGATAAVALASQSPKAVRASIVHAALAQKSVHWHQVVDGVENSTTAADVNADSGTERYTFHTLGQPGGSAWIRLVGDTVYFQGDANGLEAMLQISQAQATNYVGQWISIPKGDELYAGLADGLTLASVVHDHAPRWGMLQVSRRTSHGKRLLVVRGKSPGRVWSLAAHANGTPLPVKFTYEDLDQGVSARFSKWNEPVHVHAPASSTPIASVRGG